jgi:subtilisin family serine protease
VIGVGSDRRDEAFLTQSLPLIGQPAAAGAGHTGAGTAVAVLDTGVDFTQAAFGGCGSPGTPGCKVVVSQDIAPNDGSLDDNGHGTNVSGIVVGVAPDTKLLVFDVFFSHHEWPDLLDCGPGLGHRSCDFESGDP